MLVCFAQVLADHGDAFELVAALPKWPHRGLDVLVRQEKTCVIVCTGCFVCVTMHAFMCECMVCVALVVDWSGERAGAAARARIASGGQHEWFLRRVFFRHRDTTSSVLKHPSSLTFGPASTSRRALQWQRGAIAHAAVRASLSLSQRAHVCSQVSSRLHVDTFSACEVTT